MLKTSLSTRQLALGTALAASLALASPNVSAHEVTVVNPATDPVKTSSVDDPGRNPYRFHQQQLCFGHVCEVTTPPVPAGKRLVVQHFSAIAGFDPSVPAISFVGALVVSGNISSPLSFDTFPAPDASHASSFDHAVQVYIDAGDSLGAVMNTDGHFQGVNFILSGYLLDCTANACAPIAP
jgi:hypothetical protein